MGHPDLWWVRVNYRGLSMRFASIEMMGFWMGEV